MSGLVDFAIAHREALWRIDAAACFVIALTAVHLMQVIAKVADVRIEAGTPFPYGLETALRLVLGYIAVAAMLTVAEYLAAKVHFVLVEEVALNVGVAFLGILVSVFNRSLFPTRPNS